MTDLKLAIEDAVTLVSSEMCSDDDDDNGQGPEESPTLVSEDGRQRTFQEIPQIHIDALPAQATTDNHGDMAEVVCGVTTCRCDEEGKECCHASFWRAAHVVTEDKYHLQLFSDSGKSVRYPPLPLSFCRPDLDP